MNNYIIKKVEIEKLTNLQIDEIVDVFNQSFGTNISSIIRTRDNWLWRYKLNPNNYEDMIVLSQYNKKIIGSMIVTFKEIMINSKIYKIGMISDVAVIPEFRNKGIAKRMLNETISYIKEKNAALSGLYTADRSPAHSLYLKCGYEDIYHIQNFILSTYSIKLFIDIPYLFPLLPIFWFWYKIVKIKMKIKYKNDVKVEVLKKEDIKEFIKSLNEYYAKFIGAEEITEEYFNWKHYISPKDNETVVLVAKKNNKIVGGVSIVTQEIRCCKFQFKVGNINRLFFEEEYICYNLLATLLSQKILKETSNIWLYCNDKEFISVFNKVFAIRIPKAKAVFMINFLNEKLLDIKDKNWYIHNEIFCGIP